jgi:hypothetical protein
MSEFMFKSLSVKLFAEDALADEGVCVCCSYDVHCDQCTHCTDSPTGIPCNPCTDAGTVDCGECTLGVTDQPDPCKPCTGEITDDCFPCTDFETTPCLGPLSHHPFPCDADSCQQDTGCLDSILLVLPARRSTSVIAEELALLRAELRQTLGRTTEDERRVAIGDAESVEEIDRVKDALLEAIDELDERRQQIEGGARR